MLQIRTCKWIQKKNMLLNYSNGLTDKKNANVFSILIHGCVKSCSQNAKYLELFLQKQSVKQRTKSTTRKMKGKTENISNFLMMKIWIWLTRKLMFEFYASNMPYGFCGCVSVCVFFNERLHRLHTRLSFWYVLCLSSRMFVLFLSRCHLNIL